MVWNHQFSNFVSCPGLSRPRRPTLQTIRVRRNLVFKALNWSYTGICFVSYLSTVPCPCSSWVDPCFLAEALPKRFCTVIHGGSNPGKHPLIWRISWTSLKGFISTSAVCLLWTLWCNNSIHPFVSHPFWSLLWVWGIPFKTRSVSFENIWPDRVSIWTVNGRRAVNPFP